MPKTTVQHGKAGPQTQLCQALSLAGQLAQLLLEGLASPLRYVCPGLSNASTERRAGLPQLLMLPPLGPRGLGLLGSPHQLSLHISLPRCPAAAPHSILRLPRRPHGLRGAQCEFAKAEESFP